jgi:hypothetical protein
MRKTYSFTSRLFIVAALMLFSSCQKFIDVDFFKQGGEKAKLCIIEMITTSTPYADFTATFNYNQRGDPKSVLFPDAQVGTGRPNLQFIYDKKGRLTDYFGSYLNQFYEFWHHYRYEGNKVIGDTAYFFGAYSGSSLVGDPYGKFLSDYEYDDNGRIVKVNTKTLIGDEPDNTAFYQYDAIGNLSHFENNYYSQDYSGYDNKTNIHRTNPIWMLVDKEYSINNPYAAVSYNSNGLPVKTSLAQSQYSFLYQLYFDNAEITYQCK